MGDMMSHDESHCPTVWEVKRTDRAPLWNKLRWYTGTDVRPLHEPKNGLEWEAIVGIVKMSVHVYDRPSSSLFPVGKSYYCAARTQSHLIAEFETYDQVVGKEMLVLMVRNWLQQGLDALR